ncbi:MAG: hypothetical protein U0269_25170 [Polyangiales bacterium]
MASYGEGSSQSRRGWWFGAAATLVAGAACWYGIYGKNRPPIAQPEQPVPAVTVETGPSRWMWRGRRSSESSSVVALSGAQSTSIELTRPSCTSDDRFYQQAADGQCHPAEQALLAMVAQTAFAGAPRRHDGSDLAALLAPSRTAGEPDADSDSQRSGAARARSTTYVDDREASWCGFALEGTAPRLQLRATCALDRLDLYTGAPPRVERSQSCGVDRIEACTESCESNEDCGEQSGCGCEQSRCVRGRCTACPPRRVCAEPTFTARANPWVLRVAITSEQEPFARALAARPSAFRTLFHFAVTGANRDVRARRDGSIEFDSGYRLQVRPLALSAAACAGECRRSVRATLPLFSAPAWQARSSGMRFSCTRGRCQVSSDTGVVFGGLGQGE